MQLVISGFRQFAPITRTLRSSPVLIPYGVCVELLHARSAAADLEGCGPTSNRYLAMCREMSVVSVGRLRHLRPRESHGSLDDEASVRSEQRVVIVVGGRRDVRRHSSSPSRRGGHHHRPRAIRACVVCQLWAALLRWRHHRRGGRPHAPDPEQLFDRFRLDVRVNQEVVAIDRSAGAVRTRSTISGQGTSCPTTSWF